MDAHVFSVRLIFEFILLITQTVSTQQFIDHILVCCQAIHALLVFLHFVGSTQQKTEGTALGFSIVLKAQTLPARHQQMLGKKMFGTDPRILIIKWRVLQMKLS